MLQNDVMLKDAAVTLKIPASLKKQLNARAATSASTRKRARFLGRFAGTPVPTDADIQDVRERLWGKLTRLRNA